MSERRLANLALESMSARREDMRSNGPGSELPL